MRKREDVAWEAVVAQLDLDQLDLDDAGLELAEQTLEGAEDDAFAPERVDEIVVRCEQLGDTPYEPISRTRRIRRAAGVVLGAVLLAAAGSAGYIVWRSGVRSLDTMTYPMAIELLGRPDQPIDHRRSAMGIARGRVSYGIGILQTIEHDTAAPQPLSIVAGLRLRYLAELLSDGAPMEPGPVDDEILAASEVAQSSEQPLAKRLTELEHVADLTGNGVLALKAMTDIPPVVASDRAMLLVQLRAQLRGR